MFPSSLEAPSYWFCLFLQASGAQPSAAPRLSLSRRRPRRPFPWSPCLCVNSPRPQLKLWNPEQFPTSFDAEDDPAYLVLLERSESWSQSWGHYQESAMSLALLLGVQLPPPHPRLLKALTQQLVVSSNTQILLCSSCTQLVAFN